MRQNFYVVGLLPLNRNFLINRETRTSTVHEKKLLREGNRFYWINALGYSFQSFN